MDENGIGAGPMFKKRFTKPAHDQSDAAVSMSYRYFAGDELYEFDPEKYSKMKGRVCVQVVITPNEYAASWVMGVAKGDLSDSIIYPDESTKSALLQTGMFNREQIQLTVDWTTCTFLHFAADRSGIDGELKRSVVTFSPDNASPVSEFTPMGVTERSPETIVVSKSSHALTDFIVKRLNGYCNVGSFRSSH